MTQVATMTPAHDGATASWNEREIRALVERWYQGLSDHTPMVEMLPLLSDADLDMQFPERTLHNLVDFEDWYQTVNRVYFDEVHVVQQCDVQLSADHADLRILVRWEASTWTPPASRSERIVADAHQTWVVRRSPVNQKPVIVTYRVDALDPVDGAKRDAK